jgi:16S rRNA (cytosine967-C5)-methyltransferase
VVQAVLDDGRSLTAALDPSTERRLADAALVQELAYGSLRWTFQLDAWLSALMPKPLKAKDRDIHALLLVGLYQLAHLRVAPHAAVSETVSAVDALGKPWAKRLVNGVLRNFLRLSADARTAALRTPSAIYNHPDWLLQELRGAWPDHWQDICRANDARPPMTLRVNQRQLTRDAYLATLRAQGLDADPVPHTDGGLVLRLPMAVDKLPGFRAGQVSVQDGAAQLAAALLDAAPGMRVLDACAAPGGKTAHLLERSPDLHLVAIDQDAARLQRVQDNLARLGLAAHLVCGDAGDPAAWWDGQAVDRILLDAPCSATGVIRRHPDIKHHRTPTDILQLASSQARLLDGLWPLLAPGGKLLYVTCSILPEENELQLRAFLARQPAAAVAPLALSWAHATGTGYQILPGEQDMDGFFFACLHKSGAPAA